MTVRQLRDAGWALIYTPAIMFVILIWGALHEPLVILEDWDIYFPFIILPWAAGIALLVKARKKARRERGL